MFGGPMLLRVPAASLAGLVSYDDMLRKANAAYFGVATKVSFDMDAAYPKLVFEYDGASTEQLTANDANKIVELRDGELVKRILQEQSAQEHHAAGEAEAPKQKAKEPVRAVAQPPVIEVPEETTTAEAQEEPSPPAEPETGGVVEAATEEDVDALVQGLLND
jgi:hypothetical protein